MIKKTEFLAQYAAAMKVTVKEATVMFDTFWATVKAGLKKDGKITLTGTGNFELKDKPAREGINPLTKQKVKIPAKRDLKFKFAKAVKEEFQQAPKKK